MQKTANAPQTDDVARLRRIARMQIDDGNYELGIPLLLRVIQSHDESSDDSTTRGDDYSWLGLSQLSSRHFEASVQSFDRAIELLPTPSSIVLNNRAGAYVHLRKFDKAISDFERSVELSPDYVPARVGLAQMHICKRDFVHAQEHLNVALRLLGPTAPPSVLSLTYRRRGFVLCHLKSFGDALRDFERAYRHDPTFPKLVDDLKFVVPMREDYRRFFREGALFEEETSQSNEAIVALRGLIESVSIEEGGGRGGGEGGAGTDPIVERFPESGEGE